MRVLAGMLGWTRDMSADGIERAIRQITQVDGFGGVSFFWHYPLDQLSTDELARIRQLGSDLRISYAVHGPYLDQNIGSHYEAIRRASVQDICAALDFAAAIGAETVTFHPKMTRYGDESAVKWALLPRMREQEARSLAELAAYSAGVGVVACYENMDPTAVHYPENVHPQEVLNLITPHLGPGMGVTFDVAHAHVGACDPVAAARTLAPAMKHVHLSDNDSSLDQHRPLGQGTIDFPSVLAVLDEIGYTGLLEIELGTRDDYLVAQDYLRRRALVKV